jgi:hypothetical protein
MYIRAAPRCCVDSATDMLISAYVSIREHTSAYASVHIDLCEIYALRQKEELDLDSAYHCDSKCSATRGKMYDTHRHSREVCTVLHVRICTNRRFVYLY